MITLQNTGITRALLGQQVMHGDQGYPALEKKKGNRVGLHNMVALSHAKQSGSHMTRETTPTGVSHHVIGQQLRAADHKSALNRPQMLGTCQQPTQLARSKQSQRLTRKHLKPF